MNSLYNIFQNEKERNPDMTVYYNKQSNSISYRNEEGTLTALFRGENEYFYFKFPNKKPEEMQTRFGDMILNTYGEKDGIIRGKMQDEFFDTPERFKRLAKDYQNCRKEIGIDDDPKKSRKNKNVERD